MKKFRKLYTKEQRKKEFQKIHEKYPDRIPIIVDIENTGELFLKKRKFLVERDMLFINFIHIVRKMLKVSPNESLFFLYEGTIPVQTHSLAQIYGERKSEDGFMVLTVAKENTFGYNIY